MRPATIEIINKYKIYDLRYDFMGYTFRRKTELSYHHLVFPRSFCKRNNLGNGYVVWNGVILVKDTAHEYLHVIERVDEDMFFKITSEMLDEIALGRIDLETLRRIRDVLMQFEKEHDRDINYLGEYIIKPEFVEKRISLK